MGNKRLTVIIPGYNNPCDWWDRCIESVLANICDADEIICVDDCSVQKPSFLDNRAKSDKRIKVIYRDRNGGPSAARNDGLRCAEGQYVTFIDSDDELLPNAYEPALSALEKSGYDIAVFGVESIWVQEKLRKENFPKAEDSGVLSSKGVKSFLDNTLMFYVWNKIYRREFLDGNAIVFNEKMEMGEDLAFVLRCVIGKAKWVMLEYLGIRYYKTHSSILSRYKPTYVEGMRQASQIWKEYKLIEPGAREVLGDFGETSEKDLWVGEWDNIWRLGSPYTLKDKWAFLKQHSDITSGSVSFFFLKKFLYSLGRKCLYIRPVKRWHIKRIYTDAKPI